MRQLGSTFNRSEKMDDFVVKHYSEDEAPTFKGNGFDGIRVGDDREEAQRLADYINALRKDAERYRKLREARSALKLYVYEDKADPFSGDWQYKPSPEDVDTFADGLGAA